MNNITNYFNKLSQNDNIEMEIEDVKEDMSMIVEEDKNNLPNIKNINKRIVRIQNKINNDISMDI